MGVGERKIKRRRERRRRKACEFLMWGDGILFVVERSR